MSGERSMLPSRREALSYWFKFVDQNGAEQRYHATIGFYDGVAGGRVGEIFLNNERIDSLLDAYASDSATLASHLIQRGLSLAEIGRMLKRNGNGSPASPLAQAIEIAAREFAREAAQEAAE
jgi:hypothetical protein